MEAALQKILDVELNSNRDSNCRLSALRRCTAHALPRVQLATLAIFNPALFVFRSIEVSKDELFISDSSNFKNNFNKKKYLLS